MIWPVLFIGAVLATIARIAFANYPWWTGSDPIDIWAPVAMTALFGLIACFVAGALGYGLGRLIASCAKGQWDECWRGKMVSMRNADGPEGSMSGGIFMMSGHVGTDQVYFYYTLKNDGSFQPHRWTPDNDTSIFEESREDGEVVQFNRGFGHDLIWLVAIPDDRLRMDFHIPKGSLKQSFALK